MHRLLGFALTITWFWLLMVLRGAIAGENALHFSVRPFLGPAATWQLFQGSTIYAAIGIAAHAELLVERAQTSGQPREVAGAVAHLPRLFVKQEDELPPWTPSG
jgi:hypothetical protein